MSLSRHKLNSCLVSHLSVPRRSRNRRYNIRRKLRFTRQNINAQPDFVSDTRQTYTCRGRINLSAWWLGLASVIHYSRDPRAKSIILAAVTILIPVICNEMKYGSLFWRYADR